VQNPPPRYPSQPFLDTAFGHRVYLVLDIARTGLGLGSVWLVFFGTFIRLKAGSAEMVGRNSIAVVVGIFAALGAGMSARPAYAIKQFFDEFKAVYVKADSGDANEKALATAVEEAKCNVCHKPASKKERNAYGEALAKLLDKKEDAKNVEKIRKSLEEVAAMSSDVAKADAPTFGDLIKQGKLPGGPVVK
jgi:hypothetical protein